MSSVLDITYKRPTGFEGRVNGSMLGGGIYLGGGNSKFSLMTSLRYKTTRYLLGSLETTGEYNPDFLDYQAYLSWSPNRRWTIDVLGNISDNHYNFKPKDRETNFGTMNNAKKVLRSILMEKRKIISARSLVLSRSHVILRRKAI